MRKAVLSTALFILSCGFIVAQAQYKVLYNFQHSDGSIPFGNLVFDNAGNLFGTTQTGGIQGMCYGGGCGVVFELSPNADGTWSQSVIHYFCEDGAPCSDGASLGYGTGGLVRDSSGNLYGIEPFGGVATQACQTTFGLGCGVAYKLSPPSLPGGSWTYTSIYTFCSVVSGTTCLDGSVPLSGLIFDRSGNLYGSTNGGGSANLGTVFELSPGPNGWTETVLYSFCPSGAYPICPDGDSPEGVITFDRSGNLYGTTLGGGSATTKGGGTIFELSRQPGQWSEAVVLAFPLSRSGPKNPYGATLDPMGNLYVPFFTGDNGNGGIGRLSRGKVTDFLFDGNDGKDPNTQLLIDPQQRVLYGTTTGGGFGPGNIFQIDASGKETVLYAFCQPDCSTGSQPFGGLIRDQTGNFYGTTAIGGTTENGVVFELTLAAKSK